MSLTDLHIGKLKPRKKRFEVADVDGLFIRVLPSGEKVWSYRYVINGKQRRMTLGTYTAKIADTSSARDDVLPTVLTLAEAREKHARAMQDVNRGIDPALKVQQEKRKRQEEPTFKDLLDEFFTLELSKTPSGKARRRLIEKDILPEWTGRKVSSITRRDAVLILDEIRERAPIGANRVHSVLVRMLNFAAERGIIEFSPLGSMRRGRESARARVLTDDEIKALWKALDLDNADVDIYQVSKLAIKAILLSGQRPGEVSSMSWDHIHGDTWIIPADQRKNREENRVPILPMLAEVIERAKPFGSGSGYVFPSPRSSLYGFKRPQKAKPKEDDAPVSRLGLSNAIRRHSKDMGIEERFTPHDLRRTARTRLAELGVSDIVAERVLGHKLQGVLGIYNRHSYDVEKRQALGLWERRLSEILGQTEKQSNVIPLQVKSRG